MVRHAMKALVLISPVLVLALALLVAPAHAGSWDEENTRLHIPLTALMFIDLGQTLYIADHPEKYYEMNILLSKSKSRERIDPIASIINAYVRAMIADTIGGYNSRGMRGF